MSKSRLLGAVCACIFLLCGCMAEPQVIMLGNPGTPKTEAEDVDIYYATRHEQDYREIARIEVGDTNDEYCMGQILLKARGMGADGVIVLGRSGSYSYVSETGARRTIGNTTTSSGVGVGAGHGLAAVAIRYN